MAAAALATTAATAAAPWCCNNLPLPPPSQLLNKHAETYSLPRSNIQGQVQADLDLDSGASLGGAFQTIVYSPNGHPAVYVVQTSSKRPKQTFDPT